MKVSERGAAPARLCIGGKCLGEVREDGGDSTSRWGVPRVFRVSRGRPATQVGYRQVGQARRRSAPFPSAVGRKESNDPACTFQKSGAALLS